MALGERWGGRGGKEGYEGLIFGGGRLGGREVEG